LVRIVPRIMRRGGQRLRAFGLSSVCVRPDQRGAGLAAALLDRSLELSADRGADLAFLVARRAADHFYSRFGFLGLASYNRLLVRCEDLPRAAPGVSIRASTERDLPALSSARRMCFRRVFGALERDQALWRFTLRRFAGRSPIRWHTLVRNRRPAGYALMDAAVVYEFAWRPGEDAMALLSVLARRLRAPEQLEVRVPATHELLSRVLPVDAALVRRQCVYGGHMVRVLNYDRLGELLARRIEDAAQALGARAYRDAGDGIAVSYSNGKAKVSLRNTGAGAALGYRATCRLLGVEALSAQAFRLDQALPFNLGIADEV
jgi:hypothetical protein